VQRHLLALMSVFMAGAAPSLATCVSAACGALARDLAAFEPPIYAGAEGAIDGDVVWACCHSSLVVQDAMSRLAAGGSGCSLLPISRPACPASPSPCLPP
jgi:hypothetical protein